MAYYVTRGTVRHSGKEYLRGETVPKLPKDAVERLLRLGAITKTDSESEDRQGVDVSDTSQDKKPPSEAEIRAAREAKEKEELSRSDARAARAKVGSKKLNQGKAALWTVGGDELVGKSLEELNIMILERDPDFTSPYETIEEAVAHLGQDL